MRRGDNRKDCLIGYDAAESGRNSQTFKERAGFIFTLKMEAADAYESGRNCINTFQTQGTKP